MAQSRALGALGGSGIVAVLILSGALMKGAGLSAALGTLAMGAGTIIAIALGVLGIIGVLSRMI